MKVGFFQVILRLLCCALVLFPQYALAGIVNIPGFRGTVTSRTPVPANAVPVPDTVRGSAGLDPTLGDQSTPGISSTSGNVTVYQNQQSAIINWQSFNIGSNASVIFHQGEGTYGTNTWKPNSSYAALNRIWDLNPSQIFGNLQADGKIFLINQNGILFAPGSRVNVNSLVASALNIHDGDFLKNNLHFYAEDYQGNNNTNYLLAAVSNLGEINTADGGSVFLMAPRVDNYGAIDAPVGQIGLVAATDVLLVPPGQDDTSRSGYYVIVNDDFINAPRSADPDFGRAVNGATADGAAIGKLNSDGGMVGMYGNNVDQWGVIRSVTAYQNNKGQVELRAANKVTTYANSSIELPVAASVDPSTGLPVTISDTFDIQPHVFIGGLGSSNNADENKAANEIDLQGSIAATAGKITLRAVNRVYMESGSGIDVSGAVADLPVAALSDVKLNSVELRDYYAQKGGVLQGLAITTPETAGSTIGDLSQALLTQDKTAAERLVGGDVRKYSIKDNSGNVVWVYQAQTGAIDMGAASGDIIVKQGASLAFAGGAINYQGGLVNSTKLLSGMKVYDISSAPVNIRYDAVLGRFVKLYDRFGMKDSWTGLYYRGAAPIATYMPGYTAGGDAGALSLSAPVIVLDGRLNGGVTRGDYQNAWTLPSSFASAADYEEALRLSKAQGLEAPRAGTLNIINAGASATSGITVLAETQPQTQLTVDSPLATGQTLISARTVNDAKLGALNLTANLTIDTAADAAIQLQPGGSFSATARQIDHEGSIMVQGGTINLTTVQNSTSYQDSNGALTGSAYIPLNEKITLGKQSVLDVSGERIDNSLAGGSNAVAGTGRTSGGTVSILDETDQGTGVFMLAGARVDASGGYTISRTGKVTGGNAGALSIQGSNIELDGDLRGYALADPNGKLQGGSLTLTTNEIHVGDPAGTQPGWFVLAADRLDNTGFTRIALNSRHDLVVEQGATISPSLVRLASPVGTGQPGLTTLDPAMSYMTGPSSFTAQAGVNFIGNASSLFTGNLLQYDLNNIIPTARLVVARGAAISTTANAQSRISLGSNGIPVAGNPAVTIDGELRSPGGTISVTAKNGDLFVDSQARILATGQNLPAPSSTPKGFALDQQPLNGGNVTLSAGGALTLSPGSWVDVSGSDAVTNTVKMNGTNGRSVFTYQDAGNPGSVTLAYSGGGLAVQGSITADRADLAGLQGLPGGSLKIIDNGPNGLDVSTVAPLVLGHATGFDDLTFKSGNSLIFSADYSKAMGRKLTLDAPAITGPGVDVALRAPWIVLTNTSNVVPPALANTVVPAAGSFSLSGSWIDVIGNVNVTGFRDVTLQSARDISLGQMLLYSDKKVRNGQLATTGNLTLDAERISPGNCYAVQNGNTIIYPDIFSDFNLNAGGTMTLTHTVTDTTASPDRPIYSAGGSLTITGLGGIDVESGITVAAPLGTISLNAPGKRIYLADGSVLTTAGSTAVDYGLIDANNLWMLQNKTDPVSGGSVPGDANNFSANSLPRKSITLNAGNNGEVIARDGSTVDASGGGSVFAYKFQPGTAGSINPLTKPNRYVAISSVELPLPGQTVDLQGAGLTGTYTLLPLDANHPQNARYAFLPGAYILEAQSGVSLPGPASFSSNGYPLAVGHAGIADTSITSPRPQVYSVRTAAEVLQTEGDYVKHSFVSGDGGAINIAGNTIILDGTLKAAAPNGYQGGTISLKATNITVQATAASQLGSYFNFNTSFNDTAHPELQQLQDGLTMSAAGLQGFREVDLGDANTTNSISINTTAVAPLEAAVISLAAKNITISDNASLQAVTAGGASSGGGMLTLTTPGTLTIGNATLYGSQTIDINAYNVASMKGTLQSDNGALLLNSSAIYFDDGTRTDTGLHLTQAMWNNFVNSGFQSFALSSIMDNNVMGYNIANNPGIQFLTSVDLKAAGSLSLNATRIVNANSDPNLAVKLEASNIDFAGISASPVSPPPSGRGSIMASAANANGTSSISVECDVLFSGFSKINFTSQNDVAFRGKGSLSTGNADLAISAARVTTASESMSVSSDPSLFTTAVVAPAFVVYTGGNYNADQSANGLNPLGAISIAGNGNYKQSPANGGGTLEFQGASIKIDNNGVVQADGGSIKLAATGNVTLNNGSMVLAQGTTVLPGGQVALQSTNGGINIDAASSIDVSAGTQGDAGSISLKAPNGGVVINGTIVGAAQGSGKGGSFILDTNSIGDITILNDKLTAKTDSQDRVTSGGFTESLDLRARTGNIDVVSGQTLQAHQVKLTADNGDIDVNVNGNIIAAGEGQNSGRAELYAMNNVNINNGGGIRAVSTGSGPLDPNVLLSSASSAGSININGTIDVSDINNNANGVVYLRARRNTTNSDVNINVPGTIRGAKAIYAEAVKTYDISNSNTISAAPSASTSWMAEAQSFSANNQAIAARLGNLTGFHLLTGIELYSTGNLNWNTAWNLTGSRFGGEPGVLTLRAGGDLNINGNITDAPSGYGITSAPAGRNSWGFNLVAGADLSSANYTAVNTIGAGNLNIANNVVVYTESAPIRFASGQDTVIGTAPAPGYMVAETSMGYNLASFSGSITGNAGRDLTVAGAIQTGTGDIDISVGRDLGLLVGNSTDGSGAIRTIGRLDNVVLPPNVINPITGPVALSQSDVMGTDYWQYDNGGNITLAVGRNVGKPGSGAWTVADTGAWDYFSSILVNDSASYGLFSADYANGTAGLATMGGGNLTVHTGGDFLAQAGTFGAGNLSIQAGGDVKGRFLNYGSADAPGHGEIRAMGNFGSIDHRTQLELGNSRMDVTARGEMQIGAVLNPDLASDKLDYIGQARDSSYAHCTYTQDTSIDLTAGTDVTLAGKAPYYKNTATGGNYLSLYSETLLPANVSISAEAGDILLLNNFTMTSSPKGGLSLKAGKDLAGYSSTDLSHYGSVLMSDISAQNWYGLFDKTSAKEQLFGWITLRTGNNHGLYDPTNNAWIFTQPLHTGDAQPVLVQAGGDIGNLRLMFPKQADVEAGRDIHDITYQGQNINGSDVSIISAGNDISMQYAKASVTAQGGLVQGGPGVFMVQAGNSIDLGSLPDGIQTIGNGNNPMLGLGNSSLFVLAGYQFGKPAGDTAAAIEAFFTATRTAGDQYAALMAKGDQSGAAQLLQDTRTNTIDPLLGAPTGVGDINMTSSQIATSVGKSDIYVIASGNLNLGQTALPITGTATKPTGITTGGGGGINIFAKKDVNVQESRVMTFFSRQDMIDNGITDDDIKSGKASMGDITIWSDQGNINAGRGSRTAVSASPPKRILTASGAYVTVFTPPAVGSGLRAMTYGQNPPQPGNIHLFAPSGVIDAGEAGIAGGQVTLAALKVTNAANISFSSGSLGVPQQSAGAANIGTLSGSGSATQNSQLTSGVSGLDTTRAQAAQIVDDIIAKWLDVKVVDFVEDGNNGESN